MHFEGLSLEATSQIQAQAQFMRIVLQSQMLNANAIKSIVGKNLT